MKKTLSLLLLLALCLSAQAQIPQKEALLQDCKRKRCCRTSTSACTAWA